MSARRAVCLAAGGHAAVVIDAADRAVEALGTPGAAAPPVASSPPEIVAVLDDDPDRHGARIEGRTVRGGLAELPGLRAEGVTVFLVGLGGTEHAPRARVRLYRAGLDAGLAAGLVVHPAATVAGSAGVRSGSVILARAVLGPGSQVGENAIVNTGAIVEHDARVGDHAHVAPGSVLCGGVHVGPGAHVGAGAIVRQGLRIGPEALVGAGAVVVRDVPPGTCVVGVPARAMDAAPADAVRR